MKKMSLNSAGFTVIELLVFILVITALVVVGITNVRGLRAQNRDTNSKTDINALYYQLESFYQKNAYYPEVIDAKTLTGIDPESLKDNQGREINTEGSLYTYRPALCGEAKCRRFELTTQLEKEAPFTKQSLNN